MWLVVTSLLVNCLQVSPRNSNQGCNEAITMFNFNSFFLGILTVILGAQIIHGWGYIIYYRAGKRARQQQRGAFLCASIYEDRLKASSSCTNKEKAFARGVLGRSINILEVLEWWK